MAEICASAAKGAPRELPDLQWDDHGDVQRFELDDVRLELSLWLGGQRWVSHEDLVLVGDVFTAVFLDRRRVANVVCEHEQGRLRWYLDTVTRHPLMGEVDPPNGFAETEFFDNYEAFRHGGMHPGVRDRQPLTAGLLINF